MNKSAHRILIVDDSETDLHAIVSCLKDKYQVLAAQNGEGALQLMQKAKTDVVLLDVNMPGMDGYEVCRRIREDDELIQIIFLSANDGIDEILKGYDVGGNDYITKPFAPDVLLSKIQRSIESLSKLKQLESEKNDASSAFMTAVTSMGDLGGVINFLRSSFKVADSMELAELLLNSLSSFELSACVQLRTEFETINHTNNIDTTPLEIELLTRIAHMKERIAENGKRVFINFPKVSVLIKNMPIDDEFKMGRLRDTLAILVEGTNEKQLSIEKDQSIISMLELSNKTNSSILKDTLEGLAFIQSVHVELKHSNLNLMESTVEYLVNNFFNLGLTESQEASLTKILQAKQHEAVRLFEESVELEQQIESMLQKLNYKP